MHFLCNSLIFNRGNFRLFLAFLRKRGSKDEKSPFRRKGALIYMRIYKERVCMYAYARYSVIGALGALGAFGAFGALGASSAGASALGASATLALRSWSSSLISLPARISPDVSWR